MKSHFQFSKKQRSGIFLLVLFVVGFQAYTFWSSSKAEEYDFNNDHLQSLRNRVDSLARLSVKKNQPELFPFNPNYITDFKGANLGMSVEQIDRLFEYRRKGLWINSKKDFQKVTGVSDIWLDSISPFFKFPDWVSNKTDKIKSSYENNNVEKSFDEKTDLNLATQSQLQKIQGIGPKLSERIINYRERFDGGFADMIELTEVYGLSPEVILKIDKEFAVKTPRFIEKVPINEATIEEIVTVPYIDYEIADKIIEQRTLREGFKSLEELTKIEDFPQNKIDLIGLYLQF